MTHRTRRLLHSRWRRLTRWEFWPGWAIYPPVVLYALWLAIRYRGLTVFSAANPGMPEGGLAMESKSEILSKFGHGDPAIARWTLIGRDQTPRQKLAALAAFLSETGGGFPVVLKPDVGERGLGVAIIHTQAQAADYLADCPLDVIAQEFIGGEEFGVFYVRHPDEEQGSIISITEKRAISVNGDGQSSLEQLILNDNRAVCSARFLLRKHQDRLSEIPDQGTCVVLTDLGTHARGALFLDGSELLSKELELEIHRISAAFEGFYFGRYDLKVSDRESLRSAIGIKVLELNGVSSEPTHIYDPGHGLLYAWRHLCGAWGRAFRIGAANRRRGHRPVGVRRVLGLLLEFKRRKRWEADA